MRKNGAIKYLNSTVWCKLAPSPISGVGVFAIRDIPKGKDITDYYGNHRFALYVMTKDDFFQLHPEIQILIRQQTIFPKDSMLMFDSPNSHQMLGCFMNHSETPNCDGNTTLKKIKKGEELTKDYRLFLAKAHKFTEEILKV